VGLPVLEGMENSVAGVGPQGILTLGGLADLLGILLAQMDHLALVAVAVVEVVEASQPQAIFTVVAVVVELESLVRDQAALLELGIPMVEVALVAVVVAVAVDRLAQVAVEVFYLAAMAVYTEEAEEAEELKTILALPMEQEATVAVELSVSSGVRVDPIRRTPQTSN